MRVPTRWRVFVSSTSRDLQSERETLERALIQLAATEFVGMEYFGSRPDKPKDVCLKEVSQCQVYVGIIADRYGSIDTESGRSMTELEYRQAIANKIPCLIYLKNQSISDNHSKAKEESRARLDALKQELRREHVVTFFKNPDHLATRVILDLYNLIVEKRYPEPTQQTTPSELLLILKMYFDLEELRTLCFDLQVDYDSLRGDGKEAKARELIGYLQRRNQLDKLIDQIKKLRPDLDWSR